MERRCSDRLQQMVGGTTGIKVLRGMVNGWPSLSLCPFCSLGPLCECGGELVKSFVAVMSLMKQVLGNKLEQFLCPTFRVLPWLDVACDFPVVLEALGEPFCEADCP